MAGLTVIKKGDAPEILTQGSTSQQITRNKQLVDVPVEKIEEAHRRGYITTGQRNGIMTEKAHAVTNEMISDKGFFGAVLEKSIKHIQEGFDNIRDAVVREVPADKTEAFKADMTASAHAIWGQIQVLTGVFTAVSEVTGQQVERWALNAGASPGLARLMNISADVGTGFIPVGKATQSAVKGIQRAQKLGAKSVTNQAGAVGKSDPASVAIKRLFEEAEEPWSGKLYRSGGEGGFYHTSHEGADFYSGVTGASPREFDMPRYKNPVIIDIEESLGKKVGGVPVVTLDDVAKKLNKTVDQVIEGDLALGIEEALAAYKKQGHDVVIIHGATGSDVSGFPVEVVDLGGMVQAPIKAPVAGAVGKGAGEAGKTAEEAAKAAEAAEKAMTEMEGTNKVAMEAVGEGLKAEGVSRRGFLQFLATVPTAASAVKGMLKGGATAAPIVAAPVAETVVRKMPKRPGVSKVFSWDDEDAVLKMKDGSLVQVTGADREGSSYKVLTGPQKGISFGSEDIISYKDSGEAFIKIKGEMSKEQAVFMRGVARDEFNMTQGVGTTAPRVPMTAEQELWHYGKINNVSMQEAAKELSDQSESIANFTRWKNEAIAQGDTVRAAEMDRNLASLQQYDSKTSQRYRDWLPESSQKGKTPKDPEAEQVFREPLPEIEEPGQLVMVNGRWHVRGNSPDELLPALYGEATAREKFLADLTKFRKQMGSLTETQTNAQTREMADRLGIRLEDLANVVPGEAMNEKQMMAYLTALEPQVQEVIRLAEAVRTGGEAEFNAFASHMSQFFTFAPTFRAAEITAGRSVQILKETPPMKQITEMLTGWDPESIAKGDFQSAIRTMAEDVLAVADKPDKLMAAGVLSNSMWAQFKGDIWPMLREGYINLMLARPVTHVRNTIGNSYAAGNAIAERTTGGMFSIDPKAGLVGQEGFYLLKGMGAGIADGFAEFGKAFKGQGDLVTAAGQTSKLDYVPHQIPGIAGRIINTPGDLLRGEDNFFRTILKRGSHYAEAYREAVHAGRSDSSRVINTQAYRDKFGNESLSDFVARKANYPSREMIDTADEFATYNTFQNQLGALASKVRDVGQVGPMVLWFPFMKTPINLAKYAWDRTPGLQLISGQLYKDIAAGGVKADMAIGRLTNSNLQAMFIYQLAQEGMITGSGPVDPGLRRAWMATHQPYSVKTKDGWMPIANFEPGSTPIGLVADFAQIHNQLDEPTAAQGAMAATFAVMKGMADKTYWRTLSDLVDAAGTIKEGSSPKAQLRDVALAPAMTVATGGPFVQGITRAVDPIQRETREFMDSVMSRIPGYSKDVPPVRDYLGDPVLPPQAVGGQWLNFVQPLYEKHIPDERVRNEGDRLQVKVPAFPSSIGGTSRDDFDIRAPMPEDMAGVELTSQERDRWQELYRTGLRHPEFGIEKLILDTPEYRGTPGAPENRARQREMYMDALAMYRNKAKYELMSESPKIGARLMESQVKKSLPMLGPVEQDAAKEEAQQGMTLFYQMAPEMRDNLMRWGQPPGGD